MKDFTKTNKTTESKTQKQHMKCNVCGVTVLAFGLEVGDTCRVPVEGSAGSGDTFTCTGTLSRVNSEAVDRSKRRTDGAA